MIALEPVVGIRREGPLCIPGRLDTIHLSRSR